MTAYYFFFFKQMIIDFYKDFHFCSPIKHSKLLGGVRIIRPFCSEKKPILKFEISNYTILYEQRFNFIKELFFEKKNTFKMF